MMSSVRGLLVRARLVLTLLHRQSRNTGRPRVSDRKGLQDLVSEKDPPSHGRR